MIIQKVLKGINGLSIKDATHVLNNGIICNWWRVVGKIGPAEAQLHLNAANADLHLNHYNKPVPAGNPLVALGASKFGDVTPFISTTAGAIQQDHQHLKNILFAPFLTALRFATNNYRSSGYIFYAYVFIIGKIAIEMEQFSEEVRELHIYKDYLPYHKQGEIMAKIIIPSLQIEMAAGYDGPAARKALKAKKMPIPFDTQLNTTYQLPEKISNIREVLS